MGFNSGFKGLIRPMLRVRCLDNKYRSPPTSVSSMFNSISSFILILPFLHQSTILSPAIKTYWLHAYSEYKILGSMDMWKVRIAATPCLTYITRMSRGVQPPDTHAKLSPYPRALRPHSRLFHGDLQTASRNIGTG